MKYLPQMVHGSAWAVPTSSAERQLVVLLENGGTDLGIPGFVDRVLAGIPGSGTVISADTRRLIADKLRSELLTFTDSVLESTELALQQFNAASPEPYGNVTILRDSTATFAELRRVLFDATKAGRVIDLMIFTHGANDHISADGGINGARLLTLRTEFGAPLSIRCVYMMNCIGSSLNPIWLELGARASAGTHANNYLPEPTTHFFWSFWKAGQSFDSAVTSAYRQTIDYMNALMHGIITSTLGPAASLIASRLDIGSLDFVQQSRPEIVGNGSLTITTDALGPVSSAQGLVTTVLPSSPTITRFARTSSVQRTVSDAGRVFVTRWEAPYEVPGANGTAALAQRIIAAENFLAMHIAIPLPQHQIDALVSFACGIGADSLIRSKALRLLEAGQVQDVPAEMVKWVQVRGPDGLRISASLLARRNAEAALFSGTPFAAPASAEVREYSFQQNPVIAGIAVADAVQIGLGAAAIVQSQQQASTGSLSIAYDKQHRLLTPEARLQMPGATRPRRTYKRIMFRFPQIRSGTAHATLTIEWAGNDYGEIETPIISHDLASTSTWSHSSGVMTVTAVQRIPTVADPRAWPLSYHYEGSFDPVGNGHWEFMGDFEVNAFGALTFTHSDVKSHSLLDFPGIDPEGWRGSNVDAEIPPIPEEQVAYLRSHVPG